MRLEGKEGGGGRGDAPVRSAFKAPLEDETPADEPSSMEGPGVPEVGMCRMYVT